MAEEKPEIVEGAEAVAKAARKAAKVAREAAERHAAEAQALKGKDRAEDAARHSYLAAAYGERARLLGALAAERILSVREAEDGIVVAVTADGHKLAVSEGGVEVLTGPGYVPAGVEEG
ncbi:MAG TPA: hypothetical protein VNO79_06905 [Actinomycetota bacterium]|nr:hypothetical protein [Actinomycetota bacterium]